LAWSSEIIVPYLFNIQRILNRVNNSLCRNFSVPSLISGNLLVKVLQRNAGATGCGILVGAKIPIAISSRSDEPEQTYLSLAACTAMWDSGKYY
jgi:hypothetical protein